jgi:hypothetical protein
MSKRILTIELDYDAETLHGGDSDPVSKEWFDEKILGGILHLHSNEMGDTIGECKVVQGPSAEIDRLKACEMEMRRPLNEIVKLCQEMDYSTMCPAADLIRHIGNVGRIGQLARALLAREDKTK